MSDSTFTIDGRTVRFHCGQSILDAAAAAGIYIPHLCHEPGFAPHGSCKLCTVVIDGKRAAACTTPAREGVAVENDTPALNDDRRSLVELLFVEGDHICPACEKTGNCKLQALGYFLRMTALTFDHFYPARELDCSHPDFVLDRSRCILCALCVRASRDADRKNVFAIGGRGGQSRLLVNAATGRLGDTDFARGDVAARICPVGAILPKREAYRVPIGKRKYDDRSIADLALEEAAQQQEEP